MNRKLLFFQIGFVLMVLVTLGFVVWDIDRTLATPATDDILGHAGIFFFYFLVTPLALLVEWEVYGIVKYFFVDTYHPVKKTACKVICMLLVLAIIAMFVAMPFQQKAYVWESWMVLILLGIVHIVDFVNDRNTRIQQEWIEENTEKSN